MATQVQPSQTPTDLSSTILSTITSAPASSATVTPSSNSTSSSRAPQVHTVKAGAGGFKFEPNELHDVNVGDTVTFEFYPPDHSVARAEFGSACVPYEYTGKDKQGFWSDTQWVKTTNDLTYFNVTINSTEPIFYYCAAPDSCTGQHMIGVINPNSTQTFAKQLEAAKEATFQVKPGDPVPAEGTQSLHATGTAAPSNDASNNNHHHNSLGAGAIAGIVVGAVAFLALCAALFFYVGRAKSLKEVIKYKDANKDGPTDSPYPQSPGFAPSTPGPYSPNMGYAEPVHAQMYNQQDPRYSYVQPPQAQMSEMKYQQAPPAELASPPAAQQSFTAELEAPHKQPR